MNVVPLLTLYARAECSLCDEAREELLQMRAQGLRFELREVDIDADETAHRAYFERIPVLELEGEIVSELWLDRNALLARLDTVSGMGSRPPLER